MLQNWRVKTAPAVLWRCWDGEYAAYCAATGHTHHLEGLSAEVFERLLDAPASAAKLLEEITQMLDAPERDKLRDAVPQVVERLAAAELIEPLAS